MGEERAGEGEGAEGVDADGVEEEVVALLTLVVVLVREC